MTNNAMRLPLFISGLVVGSVLASDAALCPQGLRAQTDNTGWHLPDDLSERNTVLAAWANALRQAGRLMAWRDELLSVSLMPPLDAILQDLPPALAEVERGAARVLGIFTHAVHLVGLADDGRVWLQQRALTKATDPGLWDSLAGGLLNSRDTLAVGVLRETYEEAGLTADDLSGLRLCGMVQEHRDTRDGHIAQAVWAYSATLKPNVHPRNLDGEVIGFACVSRAELAAYIAAGQVSYEAVLAFKLAGIV
jgi:8-oxo-dGTP pyrophosphatase MutT (NUDIX family)